MVAILHKPLQIHRVLLQALTELRVGGVGIANLRMFARHFATIIHLATAVILSAFGLFASLEWNVDGCGRSEFRD